MTNNNSETRSLVRQELLDWINDYMSNSLEFDTDEKARAFLVGEIGLGEKLADEVMKYADDFRRDPLMELCVVLSPNGCPGQNIHGRKHH